MSQGLTAVERQQQALAGQGHHPHTTVTSTSDRLSNANARMDANRVRPARMGDLGDRHGSARPMSVAQRAGFAPGQQRGIQRGAGGGIEGGRGDEGSGYRNPHANVHRRGHRRIGSGGVDGSASSTRSSRVAVGGAVIGVGPGGSTSSANSSIANALRSPRKVIHPVKIVACPSPSLKRRSRASMGSSDTDGDASGVGDEGSDDSSTFSPPEAPLNPRSMAVPTRIPASRSRGPDAGSVSRASRTSNGARSGRSRSSRSPVPSAPRPRGRGFGPGTGIGGVGVTEASSGLGGTSSSASDRSSSASPQPPRRRSSPSKVSGAGMPPSSAGADAMPPKLVGEDFMMPGSPGSRARRLGITGDLQDIGPTTVQAASPISRAAAAAARGGAILEDSSTGANMDAMLPRTSTVPPGVTGGSISRGGGPGRRPRPLPNPHYGNVVPEEPGMVQEGGAPVVRVRRSTGGGMVPNAGAGDAENVVTSRSQRGEVGRERRGGGYRGPRGPGGHPRRRGGRGPNFVRGRQAVRSSRGRRRAASMPGYRPGFGGLEPVAEEDEDEEDEEEAGELDDAQEEIEYKLVNKDTGEVVDLRNEPEEVLFDVLPKHYLPSEAWQPEREEQAAAAAASPLDLAGAEHSMGRVSRKTGKKNRRTAALGLLVPRGLRARNQREEEEDGGGEASGGLQGGRGTRASFTEGTASIVKERHGLAEDITPESIIAEAASVTWPRSAARISSDFVSSSSSSSSSAALPGQDKQQHQQHGGSKSSPAAGPGTRGRSMGVNTTSLPTSSSNSGSAMAVGGGATGVAGVVSNGTEEPSLQGAAVSRGATGTHGSPSATVAGGMSAGSVGGASGGAAGSSVGASIDRGSSPPPPAITSAVTRTSPGSGERGLTRQEMAAAQVAKRRAALHRGGLMENSFLASRGAAMPSSPRNKLAASATAAVAVATASASASASASGPCSGSKSGVGGSSASNSVTGGFASEVSGIGSKAARAPPAIQTLFAPGSGEASAGGHAAERAEASAGGGGHSKTSAGASRSSSSHKHGHHHGHHHGSNHVHRPRSSPKGAMASSGHHRYGHGHGHHATPEAGAPVVAAVDGISPLVTGGDGGGEQGFLLGLGIGSSLSPRILGLGSPKGVTSAKEAAMAAAAAATAALDDIKGMKLLQHFRAHSGAVLCAEFSRKGTYLATGGADGLVKLWRIGDPEEEAVVPPTRERGRGGDIGDVFSSSRFLGLERSDSDVSLASVSSMASVVSLANTASGSTLDCQVTPRFEPTGELVLGGRASRVLRGHNGDVVDLSWSPSAFLLSAGRDGSLRLWHPGKLGCQYVFPQTGTATPTSCAFHPRDPNSFATTGEDGKVRMWAISSGNVVAETQMPVKATHVRFSPHGRAIATGLMGGQVRFLAAETLQLMAQVELRSRKASGEVSSIAFNHDPQGRGEVLISGGSGRLRLYRIEPLVGGQAAIAAAVALARKSGGPGGAGVSKMAKLKGHLNPTMAVRSAVSEDGKLVVSGSEDGFVHVWDATPEAEASFGVRGHVALKAVSPLAKDVEDSLSPRLDTGGRRSPSPSPSPTRRASARSPALVPPDEVGGSPGVPGTAVPAGSATGRDSDRYPSSRRGSEVSSEARGADPAVVDPDGAPSSVKKSATKPRRRSPFRRSPVSRSRHTSEPVKPTAVPPAAVPAGGSTAADGTGATSSTCGSATANSGTAPATSDSAADTVPAVTIAFFVPKVAVLLFGEANGIPREASRFGGQSQSLRLSRASSKLSSSRRRSVDIPSIAEGVASEERGGNECSPDKRAVVDAEDDSAGLGKGGMTKGAGADVDGEDDVVDLSSLTRHQKGHSAREAPDSSRPRRHSMRANEQAAAVKAAARRGSTSSAPADLSSSREDERSSGRRVGGEDKLGGAESKVGGGGGGSPVVESSRKHRNRRCSDGEQRGTRTSSATVSTSAVSSSAPFSEKSGSEYSMDPMSASTGARAEDRSDPGTSGSVLTPPPAYSDVAYSAPCSPATLSPPGSSPIAAEDVAALAIGGRAENAMVPPSATGLLSPSSPDRKQHRRSSWREHVITAALEPASPPSTSPPPAYDPDAQWGWEREDGTGSRRKGHHPPRGSRRARENPGSSEAVAAPPSAAPSTALPPPVPVPVPDVPAVSGNSGPGAGPGARDEDLWADVSEAGSIVYHPRARVLSKDREGDLDIGGDGGGDAASSRGGTRRSEKERDSGARRPHLVAAVPSPSRSSTSSPKPPSPPGPGSPSALSRPIDAVDVDENTVYVSGARSSVSRGAGGGEGLEEWVLRGVTAEGDGESSPEERSAADRAGRERGGAAGDGGDDSDNADRGQKVLQAPVIEANSLLIATDSRGVVRVYAKQSLFNALQAASPLASLAVS